MRREIHVPRNLGEQGALRSAPAKGSHQGFTAALDRVVRAFSRHRDLEKTTRFGRMLKIVTKLKKQKKAGVK